MELDNYPIFLVESLIDKLLLKFEQWICTKSNQTITVTPCCDSIEKIWDSDTYFKEIRIFS